MGASTTFPEPEPEPVRSAFDCLSRSLLKATPKLLGVSPGYIGTDGVGIGVGVGVGVEFG
jgi:hypothetical protein